MKKPQILLNERTLRFKELHVIGSDNKFVGVMNSRDALKMAQDEDLDLFIVSSTTNPPVAKILDYGQMKYAQDKREKANQKHKQDTKEIKISIRIQQHDMDVFIKRAIKFLEHGDKVKLTCVYKSREIEHADLGFVKIKSMLESLNNYCVYDGEPVLSGKILSIIVSPKKHD